MSMARAIANFTPAPGMAYELRLSSGDEVEVINISSNPPPPGWLTVRHATNGAEGLVPSTFLEMLAADERAAQMQTEQYSVSAAAPDGTSGWREAKAPSNQPSSSHDIVVENLDDRPMESSVQAVSDGADSSIVTTRNMSKGSDSGEEKANWRIVSHAFKPEAGAVFELSISKNDPVEIVMVDYDIPDGWIVVKHLGSDSSGLVPLACLAPWPSAVEEDSLQKQKEDAEQALSKALAEKADMAKQLEERQQRLQEEERARFEAEQARRKSSDELKAMEKAKEVLEEQMAELNETTASLKEQAEVVEGLPTFKAMIASRVEEQKGVATEEERLSKLRDDTKDRVTLDEAEAEHQADALIQAERARESVARRIEQLDQERVQAMGQLTKAHTKYLEVSRTMNAKDQAAATTERMIQLLPRVKELLTPSQNELKAFMEVMTDAVMKHAEESATVLLETLVKTNDPQAAIRLAFKERATRNLPTLSASMSGAAYAAHNAPEPSSAAPAGIRQHRLAPMMTKSSGALVRHTSSAPLLHPPSQGVRRAPSLRSIPSRTRAPLVADGARPLGVRQAPSLQRPASASSIPMLTRTTSSRQSLPHRMRNTVAQGRASELAGANTPVSTKVDQNASSDGHGGNLVATRAPPRPPSASLYKRGRRASTSHAERLAKAREQMERKKSLQMGAFSR